MTGEEGAAGPGKGAAAGEDRRNYSGGRAELNGGRAGNELVDGRINGAQQLPRAGLNGSRRGPPRTFAPETFTTSRLLDFATKRELTAQIGHQPSMWPQVAVKELVDNSLDAAEQAETAPRVEVTVTENMIEVRDNGPGIPGDVIGDVLDFTVRVSSREAYVGPTRGAQGNALKTLLVMPFVLDGNAGRVEIESLGVHHKILFAIDRIAQEPKAEIVREASLVINGAIGRLHWPDSASSILAAALQPIRELLYRFAAFNPHLHLIARVDANRPAQFWEPTNPTWQRWRPCDPAPAHWYDVSRFDRLISAMINADRRRGRVRTVRELVAQFRGLSGTAKQKAILAQLGLARATRRIWSAPTARSLTTGSSGSSAPCARRANRPGPKRSASSVRIISSHDSRSATSVGRASSTASGSTPIPARRGSRRPASPSTTIISGAGFFCAD
jgi:Histidine kinase-, DNA gyrase B-, and HSP90-like ATPase